MFSVKRFTAAMAIATTLAVSSTVVPAMAQPQNVQRGLVNVAVFEVIDDVTVVVQDINVAVVAAANIAANVCGVTVPVAVLAELVIIGGGEFTCTNDSGDTGITVSQQ